MIYKYGIMNGVRAHAIENIERKHKDTIWNVINRCLDEGMNKRQIARTLPFTPTRLTPLVKEHGPEWLVEKWEQWEAGRAEQGIVPREDYDLIYALYDDGMTRTEIASKWECSRRAIDTVLRRREGAQCS